MSVRRNLCLSAILFGVCFSTPAGAELWPNRQGRVEESLRSTDLAERRTAAARLRQLPMRTGRPLARAALRDADTEVRLAAAQAIVKWGDDGAGDYVIDWLQERDPRLRIAGCQVIEAAPTANSLGALVRTLGDGLAEVRLAAVAALGSSGLASAVSPLLGHLDDKAIAVRREVVRALGRIGDQRAVVPLVSKLQDQEVAVRREAARALGRLGDRRANTTLVLGLRDRAAVVRVASLRALGTLAAKEAVTPIRALFRENVTGAVRSAAIDTLGAIGSADAVALLIDRLEAEGPRAYGDLSFTPVRRALVRAGPTARSALRRILREAPSRRLASSAVYALGLLGGPAVRRDIERATRSGVVSGEAGLAALAALGDRTALPFVLERLDDREPETRRFAAEAALKLLDPTEPDGRAVDVVGPRARRLTTPLGERILLARVLGQTGSPRAEPILRELAGREQLALRVAALEGLAQQTAVSRKGGVVLLKALDDEEPVVRRAAAEALRRVGRGTEAEVLVRRLTRSSEQDRVAIGTALSGALARSDSVEVSKMAFRVLNQVKGPTRDALLQGLGGTPAGGEWLAQWAQRPEPDDRRKVAEALAARPRQLKTLLQLARDHDAAVRANAYWSLGAVATAKEKTALRRGLADRDVAVVGNAVSSWGRLLSRQSSPPTADEAKSICALLNHRRPYVRAAAIAAAAKAGVGCGDRIARVLARDGHFRVRLAAARYLHRVAGGTAVRVDAGKPSLDPARARSALRRCVADDRDATVAGRCAEPAPVEKGSGDLVVFVVPSASSKAPVARAPYALVFADGRMRFGLADRRGAVFEADAPSGPVELAVPAALAW